ncbi:MAG: thioredoxin domain-containing protein [Flavobacteriales bacterium]|nr:thioredoxin domain-containing protein [Flavobacteriales bacterium]NCP58685.1 thioredoxin domain-containing protein [Flavobacteriales bacterium]
MNPLKTLLQYLDAEKISIDKEEFDFQFNSHPDYPSLLALCDTLTFFNIDNAAFKVDKAEIDLLPNNFIAKLKKGHTDFLSFVERKENKISYTNGTEQKLLVTKHDFVLLWDDVVLLVENDKGAVKQKSKNWINSSLLLLSALLFVSLISIHLPNKWFLIFYVFPVIGVILSIAALKELFNVKNSLLDNFCNASSFTDCNSVINSSKWKLFEKISYSDLSITFFTVQIIALFIMGLTNRFAEYFFIQKLILLSSVPIILLSLYYQKFVEKKWCPICLSIVGILLFELGYTFYLQSFFDFSINFFGITLYLFTSTLVFTIWYFLKNSLKKLNRLKEAEVKANRFKRNYSIFKRILTSNEKFVLPDTPLAFGNDGAPLEIGIVTSPFCGYCQEPHYMLKSILKKYNGYVKVSTLYNANPKIEIFRKLTTGIIDIKLSQGEEFYYRAMDDWYKTKDSQKLLEKFQINTDTAKIEQILKTQHEWCKHNNFNFTPCLFVNGYRYPKEYDIADLPFFIDELLDDTSFGEKKSMFKIVEAEKL